jgi:hypothetical protein
MLPGTKTSVTLICANMINTCLLYRRGRHYKTYILCFFRNFSRCFIWMSNFISCFKWHMAYIASVADELNMSVENW